MTKQETVELGQYCEDLMNQDYFVKLVGLFETQTIQHMLSTKPEEKQKREDVYASFSGVRDFIGLMTFYKQSKDQIIAEDEAPSEDTPDALEDIDN